ncbi:transcriptional regulator [Streptomyces sp. NPDC088745]|uniref:transcriptional regulator n=1 Tax=Streptomyces sp. NPDC088745 TaxID=3365884 RepID=UPI00382B95D4
MGRPPLDRQPNKLLTHWLNRAGMSNRELARAIASRAKQDGQDGIQPDESRVRRWGRGETPRAPVPQYIVDVLSEKLGLALTCPDLGFPDPGDGPVMVGPDLPWQSAATIKALVHLTRSEVMLPTTRQSADAAHIHTGDSLLAPLQAWVGASPTSPGPAPGKVSGRVGTTEVEGIRAVTTMFREMDNRHGGVLSRKAVVAQLDDAVAMLDSCTYTEETGRALFSAVADLGSVAGWMSFDAGRHKGAQRLFVTALHAAAEGGDKALGAHILQCMARQMSHLEHFEDALDLVALAQYGARRHMSAATASMLAALEARFHAILGNLTESESAAGRAEDSFTRVNPADEPAHMAFFDEAELAATLGVAHQIAAKHSSGAHQARRAEKSVHLLARALDQRPEHRVRSKAFDHLGLARTHLTVGELDAAHLETGRALELFGTISSLRVADRLTELHDEAAPYDNSPTAQDLRAQIADAVAAR